MQQKRRLHFFPVTFVALRQHLTVESSEPIVRQKARSKAQPVVQPAGKESVGGRRKERRGQRTDHMIALICPDFAGAKGIWRACARVTGFQLKGSLG